jgi:hypothetical protein
MAWINAFDNGACMVQLQADNGLGNVAPVWTGSLAKGGSQDIADISENVLTVAVSADGVVSLNSAQSVVGRTFNLTVQPDDFGDSARISNVQLGSGALDVYTSGFFDAQQHDIGAELTIASPCTPNPSTFPSVPVENPDAPDVLTPSIGIDVDFSP